MSLLDALYSKVSAITYVHGQPPLVNIEKQGSAAGLRAAQGHAHEYFLVCVWQTEGER